jgi:hypothetical protein
MNKYEKLNCLLELCKEFGWKPNDYLYTRNHNIRRDLSGRCVIASKMICQNNEHISIMESEYGVWDFSENENNIEVYISYDANIGKISFPFIHHTISLNENVGFIAVFWPINISYVYNKETFESILQQCEENFAQMSKHIKDFQMKVREKNLKKDF